MSDWNPAEMIGNKPKPLAISLYSELITNRIWGIQRKEYGYKDVSPNILMVNLAGTPFIDLRTDINSFLPSNLDNKISEKISNNSIKTLEKKPFLHDKIEFDLLLTCFDFDWSSPIDYVNHTKNWFELWSKAGATPHYKVEDPNIYIKNFN